jgi:4-diphosphocytidyl-2-C-methyl-D-erythritol kinase
MQLRAPAKINLSLQILGPRPDGFHDVETLIAPISLWDDITLHRTGLDTAMEFRCDDPSLPVGDDNLAVHAARLFLHETGTGDGIAIKLRKQIPHGAGLGGGSSDAATVLLGLNRMFGGPLTLPVLAEVAGRIGSDIPFFIFESAAICRGRGEIVEPTKLSRQLPLLLIKPAFGVPTPWAYGRWRNAKELPGISYARQDFEGFVFVNDLERPVFEKHLFLARAKMWLLAQPEVGAALLSGSGSTILAALRNGADGEGLAARAKAELDPELWTCLCKTAAC